MTKKQKFLMTLCIMILCVLTVRISFTLSYLVRNIETENIVQFGHVKMQLIETEMDGQGVERPVDLNETVNLSRNSQLDRRIKVKNVGEHPAYIRIKLEFALTDGEEASRGDVQQYMTFDYDDVNWTEKDGWYYYNKILQPGETTTALMTTLNFDSNALSTHYTARKMELDVKAYAVQSKNNAENVLEVEGWPEEIEE